MSDTSDSVVLHTTFLDASFRTRVRLRFISAAVSVVNEATSTPNHNARVSFAGAVFANSVNLDTLLLLVMSNSTIRTAILAVPATPGGSVLDSDIDTQVSSVFTGVALSRIWG